MVRSRWFIAFVVVLLVITGVGRIPLTASGMSPNGGSHRWEPERGSAALVADRQGDVESDESAVNAPVVSIAALGRDVVPGRFPSWRRLPVGEEDPPSRLRHAFSDRWARAPPSV